MSDDKKNEHAEVPDPELLPPRDVMTLINPSPSAGGLGGLLGATPDASTTPAPDATHTAGDATHVANSHIPAADGQPTTSDQPQSVPVDSTKSASSTT